MVWPGSFGGLVGLPWLSKGARFCVVRIKNLVPYIHMCAFACTIRRHKYHVESGDRSAGGMQDDDHCFMDRSAEGRRSGCCASQSEAHLKGACATQALSASPVWSSHPPSSPPQTACSCGPGLSVKCCRNESRSDRPSYFLILSCLEALLVAS